MTKTLCLTAAIMAVSVGHAQAAPVSATSGLDITHNYIINGGNVPQGIRLSVVPGALDISSNVASTVDDPASDTAESQNVVIGDPFATPAVPFTAVRTRITTAPPSDNLAAAGYAVEATSIDDPDANPFDTSITERRIDNSGGAQLSSSTGDVALAGSSRFMIERGYQFENTSNDLISFNLIGQMTADMSASADGFGTQARTAAFMDIVFADAVGVNISYLALTPYLPNITETGPGASVTQSLFGDDTGLTFSSVISATGSDVPSEGLFDMTFRYRFGVSMQAGASVSFLTGFNQSNGVNYTVPAPQPPAVPLPASLPFLLVGLSAMFAAGRLRRAA